MSRFARTTDERGAEIMTEQRLTIVHRPVAGAESVRLRSRRATRREFDSPWRLFEA